MFKSQFHPSFPHTPFLPLPSSHSLPHTPFLTLSSSHSLRLHLNTHTGNNDDRSTFVVGLIDNSALLRTGRLSVNKDLSGNLNLHSGYFEIEIPILRTNFYLRKEIFFRLKYLEKSINRFVHC